MKLFDDRLKRGPSLPSAVSQQLPSYIVIINRKAKSDSEKILEKKKKTE